MRAFFCHLGAYSALADKLLGLVYIETDVRRIICNSNFRRNENPFYWVYADGSSLPAAGGHTLDFTPNTHGKQDIFSGPQFLRLLLNGLE